MNNGEEKKSYEGTEEAKSVSQSKAESLVVEVLSPKEEVKSIPGPASSNPAQNNRISQAENPINQSSKQA